MTRDSTIKVVILSDALPQRNGAGSYYYDLVENLRDYVGHIELICPGQEAHWHSRISMPLPGDATQHVGFPRFKRIRTHLDAIQPNVIISATPGPFGLYGKKLARRYGARFLVGYHTSFENLTKLFWSPLMGYLIKRYFILMNNMLFKTANAVVANSDEMLANASHFGAPKTRLVATPIPHLYTTKPLAKYPGQVSRILFAGRLSAEKNLEGILRSVDVLPTMQFSIAGDGPLRDVVETADKHHANLTYHGWTEREQLLNLIDEHDLLILPSYVESFGTIALEAMARGRIVLVSEHCGILNWPELKQALYQFSDEEGLTRAIERVASISAEELSLMAENAHEAAMEFNHWNIEDWLKCLKEND